MSSEDFESGDRRYGFECPGCHENRVIETDLEPDELKGRVFRCGNCDEKVLMNDHVEAPA